MYYVIYSPDPYLLARMATDLQCEGYGHHKAFEEFNPFEPDKLPTKWLAISGGCIYFINHNGGGLPTRFTLTEKNYLKVLGEIINAKNKTV